MMLAGLLMIFNADSYALSVPQQPDPNLTPGALCKSSDAVEFAHPQRFPICARMVDVDRKNRVFAAYELKWKFKSQRLDRNKHFVIDHYIPLSVGGSNDERNLWPQHLSVTEQTLGVERFLYHLIRDYDLPQDIAIAVVKKAKNNLKLAPLATQRMTECLEKFKFHPPRVRADYRACVSGLNIRL